MKQTIHIILTLITFLVTFSCKEPSREQAEQIMADRSIPAMAYAVVKKDKIVESEVLGTRVSGKDIPVGTNDVFHWGSISKSVTALLAMILVQEGVIRMDTSLGEVLTNTRLNPKMKNITLEQLLSHTSGLPRDYYYTKGAVQKIHRINDPVEGRKYIVKEFLVHDPAFTNGFHYSNLGYIIAAALLEAAAGQSYEKLARDKVFLPLGMASANFDDPTSYLAPQKPVGHKKNNSPAYSDLPAAFNSAGRVQSTLSDFIRYARYILQGINQGQTLVRQDLFEELFKAREEGYGLGWNIRKAPWSRGEYYSHDGSNGLHHSRVLIFPGRELAIIQLINRQDGRAANSMTHYLMKKYVGKYRRYYKRRA